MMNLTRRMKKPVVFEDSGVFRGGGHWRMAPPLAEKETLMNYH
jgi:hypothetical protein